MYHGCGTRPQLTRATNGYQQTPQAKPSIVVALFHFSHSTMYSRITPDHRELPFHPNVTGSIRCPVNDLMKLYISKLIGKS